MLSKLEDQVRYQISIVSLDSWETRNIYSHGIKKQNIVLPVDSDSSTDSIYNFFLLSSQTYVPIGVREILKNQWIIIFRTVRL